MSICQDPSSLCLFHTFLFNTHSNEAKYLALQIIKSNILFGWSALSDSDRNKIRTELFNLLITWCSRVRLKGPEEGESNFFGVQVQLVHQLDSAIIEILLAEWPQGWPNFLNDFIRASKSHAEENSESTIYVLLNAIYFMGQLSDQIRTNQNIVSIRKTELSAALSSNFHTIYSFLKTTLTIDNPKIQIECLNALSCYFQWIDLKTISSDNIIENILGPIMSIAECRPSALKCILSIISRDLIVASPIIEQIFNELIERISSELSLLEDPELIEIFVSIFSKFICLDRCALLPNDTIIQWMIEYTKAVEDDLLVEIISMWHTVAKCCIIDTQSLPFSNELLIPLQEVLCSKMFKPVEFGGDKNFYDDYSETLLLLFKFQSDEILHIIVEKIDSLPFSSDEMMSWVFSIGAVSGVRNASEEAEIISAIFGIILRYSNQSGGGNSGGNDGNSESGSGPSISSMADASFLYLAGQYTRYLLGNQQYFNLALRKIEECVTSGHPESQVVALYSFKKIAIGCGKILVKTDFAQKLFQQFNDILQQLPADLHLTLFEAAMNLVKNNPNKSQRDEMALELFQRVDTISIITDLIPIVNQLSLQAMDSMIHSMISQFTSAEIEEQTKKNFYDLFIRFIETFPNTTLLDDFTQLFLDDFGSLASMISNSTADGNGTGTLVGIAEANVKSLSGLAAVIRAHNEVTKRMIESQHQQQQQQGEGENAPAVKIENPNGPLISNLFTNVIVPSFEFIKENFVDFPSLRRQFFLLIQAFCDDCSLMEPDVITELLNIVFFGLKHPDPFISEICLNTVTNILSQFDKYEDESFVNGFYENFYVPLLTNLLALSFDGLHNSFFSTITQTILHLLAIAASGKFNQITQQNLTEIIFKKLHELFQSCSEDEINMVANDIVNSVGDAGKLRSILSDFIISSRQVQITTSPSMDDELIEHPETPRAPEMEFLNEPNSANQIAAESFVFPE